MMKMKKGNTALVVSLLLVAIAISVCVMPAFAKINCEADSSYDLAGESSHYGEEIHVTLTIDPGENPAHNLSIDISEVDALIDDNSFVETRLPAGVSVTLTQAGHTFFYDRLGSGESVKLEFNAYPKTIGKEEINAVNVVITYDQLGDHLDEEINVITALDNSTWFQYEQAKEEITVLQDKISSTSWMLYVGIVGIIIGVVSLLLLCREKKTKDMRIGEKLYDFEVYLKTLKDKTKETERERSIEDKIEKIGFSKEYKKYTRRLKK